MQVLEFALKLLFHRNALPALDPHGSVLLAKMVFDMPLLVTAVRNSSLLASFHGMYAAVQVW